MYSAGHAEGRLRALAQEWGLVAAQKEFWKVVPRLSPETLNFLVFSPLQLK